MEYLQYFISFWLILILLLSFVKLKVGVSLFLLYMICVPFVMINIGDKTLGVNVINTTFLVSYLLHVYLKNEKIDWQPFVPFIAYYLLALVVIPLQSGMPLIDMFDQWRKDVMMYTFLPFVMWNVMKNDHSSIKLFKNTILLGIVIAVAYGLFLTTQGGNNPYQMIMLIISGGNGNDVDWAAYYSAFGSGRIFGRISSIFQHPMQFALFLGFSSIYVFFIRKYFKKPVFVVLVAAIGFMAVACGVRSVLGGLVVTTVYYFLKERNLRMAAYIVFFGIFFYLVVSQIPMMSAYLGSVADINNSSGAISGGSSIGSRIDQFYGAIDEMKNDPYLGLGYGWTDYYQRLYGNHPVCYAFESLLMVIICNYGAYGFVLWGILICGVLQNNTKMNFKETSLVNALFVFYVSYSCITGDYGYVKFFLIFYVLMLGESLTNDSEDECDDSEGEAEKEKEGV